MITSQLKTDQITWKKYDTSISETINHPHARVQNRPGAQMRNARMTDSTYNEGGRDFDYASHYPQRTTCMLGWLGEGVVIGSDWCPLKKERKKYELIFFGMGGKGKAKTERKS